MPTAAGRPRDPRVDARISRAALDLLREQGPDAVNVDAVARRSGVARTSVYRRFPDRHSLLAETLAHHPGAARPHAASSVEDKVRWFLDEARALVDEEIGRGAVAAVLTGGDPLLTETLREALVTRVRALQEEVDADVASGRLLPGTDAETLAALALGAHLGELLLHGEAREGWADGVAELLARGIRPRPA